MSEFGEIQGYMFHFRDGKPLMEGDNLIPAYACLCAARSSVECGCGAFDWPIPKRDEMEKIESIARSYQPITDGNDMTANIEALVKKHIAPFGLSNAGGYARLVRDALTEQAETHAIELRAYEATVANLNGRIRQMEAERVPVFQFDEGKIACAFLKSDSGYGITLHKSEVAGIAGQDVPDENMDKLSPPLSAMLFKYESHARNVYKALIAAPAQEKV